MDWKLGRLTVKSATRALFLAAMGVAVCGCATVGPTERGEPLELVPTDDFTMRLPPFVMIEILRTQRVSVIGTTVRRGQSYRVVSLPHPAASGLRFFVNDDGSFEGSAINVMGSRMGFSYKPAPADVRLVPVSEAPEPARPAAINADHAAARNSLDVYLAHSLKDPTSVMQYASSDVTECRNVANMPRTMRDNWCICYRLNAKNSWGAYGGVKYAAASLVGKPPIYHVVAVPDELFFGSASGCTNMTPRDAALIKDNVD